MIVVCMMFYFTHSRTMSLYNGEYDTMALDMKMNKENEKG